MGLSHKSQDKKDRRLGVHTSIAGGLHLSLKRAKALGCTTMQIFAHNPRGWIKRKVDKEEVLQFRRYARLFDISPIFIHSSYLINLASSDEEVRIKSIELLTYELSLAHTLGVDYIVLHPGRAVGQPLKRAIRRAAEALSIACREGDGAVGILLENTAGQTGDIAFTIPLISEIIESTSHGSVKGICLDTCHAFAAGYDITSIKGLERLKGEIIRYLSPLRVELIHLNDSRRALSSRVDRHQHIGKGGIGLAGFRRFLSFPSFNKAPLILETPKESEGDDVKNLQRVRRLLKGR